MEIAKRPMVLLLSLLVDKPKDLTEITIDFEALLQKIYDKHCRRHEINCSFQTEGLLWLEAVEYTIAIMCRNKLVELSDKISYKYRITSIGKRFLNKNKRELEEYFSLRL